MNGLISSTRWAKFLGARLRQIEVNIIQLIKMSYMACVVCVVFIIHGSQSLHLRSWVFSQQRAWQDGAPPTHRRRRLVLAVDKTYALQGVDVVALRQGRGYIGTAFHPKILNLPASEIEQQNTGFLPIQSASSVRAARQARLNATSVGADASAIDLEADPEEACEAESVEQPAEAKAGEQSEETEHGKGEAWDASSLDYAHEICEFLLFDPCIKGNPRLSVNTVPTSYSCTGWDMLVMVGCTLEQVPSIKTLTLDNAATHGLLKSFMLGTNHGLSEEEVAALPFWRHVQYIKFPSSCLPRWPFSKPVVNSEVLYLLNGPAHVLKNCVSAVRSPTHTLWMGDYFVDQCACLDLQMPPGAYVGFDSQSDKEALTYSNCNLANVSVSFIRFINAFYS